MTIEGTADKGTHQPEQTHSADYNRGWADGQARALDSTQPVIDRLQQALRVAHHEPHDQGGEPVEGFPTCSVCGAIQTTADKGTLREALERGMNDHGAASSSVMHCDASCLDPILVHAGLAEWRDGRAQPRYSEEYGGFTFKPDPPAALSSKDEPLDVAWAAVAAAVPDGWKFFALEQAEDGRFRVGKTKEREAGRWSASISRRVLPSNTNDIHWDFVEEFGDTPVEALRNLAVALSKETPA